MPDTPEKKVTNRKKSASPYKSTSSNSNLKSVKLKQFSVSSKQASDFDPVKIGILGFILCVSLLVLFFSARFLIKSITQMSSETSAVVSSESYLKEDPSDNTIANSSDTISDSSYNQSEFAETPESLQADSEEVSVAEITPTSITITLVGDCTLGTDTSFDYETSLNQYYDDYGSSYFMENVKDIFEADDLTIANLEGTFTDSTERSEHTFCFKAPASFSQILTDGSIEAVNMANNHSQDYLRKGYEDTKSALDKAGVVHFGYEETAIMDIKGVKVGLVGTYELIEGTGIEGQMKENIEKVKADGADIVILVIHWGDELDISPNYNQLYLAHKAIDYGADLVCGGHAHVIQGIETYKGKNILYGIANFCFGGNMYPHELDTMIYQQTFTVDQNGVKDDLVTNIIPCSVSSEYYYNNYQPTPLTGERAQEVLDKLEARTNMIPEYTD